MAATHQAAHDDHDQYKGSVAQLYVASKKLPFRTLVERPTIFGMLPGSSTAPAVLDLACGDGWYSRLLLAAGASRVHGVDLSDDIVSLGRSIAPPGLTLSVGDCADASALADLGVFDVVNAAYLFNYARNDAELRAMAAVAHAHTAVGGRLIAINDNPFVTSATPAEWAQMFGFTRAPLHDGPLAPNDAVRYAFRIDYGSFSFDNIWHPPAAYEAAFRAAGFTSFEWVRCEPPTPEAVAAYAASADAVSVLPTAAQWDDFCAACPLIGFKCGRAE